MTAMTFGRILSGAMSYTNVTETVHAVPKTLADTAREMASIE